MMKRKVWLQYGLLLLALAASAALGVWLGMVDQDRELVHASRNLVPAGSSVPSSLSVVASSDRHSNSANALSAQASPTQPETAKTDDIEAHIETAPSVATQQFARSIHDGDARIPPIRRTNDEVRPTEEELDDPDRYLDYEARNEKKLFKAYVFHADEKIAQLTRDIALARAEGLSEDQIREGEEKLRRIQAMKNELTSIE